MRFGDWGLRSPHHRASIILTHLLPLASVKWGSVPYEVGWKLSFCHPANHWPESYHSASCTLKPAIGPGVLRCSHAKSLCPVGASQADGDSQHENILIGPLKAQPPCTDGGFLWNRASGFVRIEHSYTLKSLTTIKNYRFESMSGAAAVSPEEILTTGVDEAPSHDEALVQRLSRTVDSDMVPRTYGQ